MRAILLGLGMGWVGAVGAVASVALLRRAARWLRLRREVKALLRSVEAYLAEADGPSRRAR